jgi:hypothetical protein
MERPSRSLAFSNSFSATMRRDQPLGKADRRVDDVEGTHDGSGAGNPNASRLITCRRSETEPLTFGSRSASAVQRAP